MDNRISIKLPRGLRLVAEAGADPDYPMEIYIGIEDADGGWVQDIAVVMNNYHYKPDGQLDYTNDAFKVLVYEDNGSDDYTMELLVPVRSDL